MKPTVLFVITQDPRKSARPAEAIRIAAGVGTWKKTDIRVYLRDAAVLVLSEFTDELVDEDNFIRYLPILGEFAKPVLVQHGSPRLADLGEPALPFEEIDDDQLAVLCGECTCLARF
jgi:sulfur relay (sulfurtransferase) DsrF/TusC family protein